MNPTTRGNIVATAVAGALSLLVGEVVLRAFIDLPLKTVLPEVRYDPHPVRRFTLRASQSGFTYGAPFQVDERGFRVNGGQPAGGDDPSIFALGDSFTFGMAVRDEETWPARLEAALRGQGTPVRVTNGGTISYGVFQEMDLLRSAGLATRPRVIVHALYWNDFMNAAPPPANAPSLVTPGGYLAWDRFDADRHWATRAVSTITNRSALLYGLRRTAKVTVTRGGGDAAYGTAYARFLERGLTDEEWQPVERFYAELQALAREQGISTFVIITPVDGIVAKPGAEQHPYPAGARRRLEALGIPYLDTFELWSKAGAGAQHFLPQGADSHLDAEGYRIVAEAAAAQLRRTGVLAALDRPAAGAAPR